MIGDHKINFLVSSITYFRERHADSAENLIIFDE